MYKKARIATIKLKCPILFDLHFNYGHSQLCLYIYLVLYVKINKGFTIALLLLGLECAKSKGFRLFFLPSYDILWVRLF